MTHTRPPYSRYSFKCIPICINTGHHIIKGIIMIELRVFVSDLHLYPKTYDVFIVYENTDDYTQILLENFSVHN